MIVPLSQAPYDTPLLFEQATDKQLAQRFSRLGIARGDVVKRLSEEAMTLSARVGTPKGEVVLAPGMASKVIVHHDDGHKTPVAEMQPGEEGHVEGLVCGTGLEQGLRILGIRENDRIILLRRLPPMDYVAIKNGARLTLTEGAAAKIWGTAQGREMQFAVAGKGVPFIISVLLGGARATGMLLRMGLAPGEELLLESVRPASSAGSGAMEHGVLQTQSGLRLHLRPEQEAGVLVVVS